MTSAADAEARLTIALDRLDRRTIRDAERIANLYERIAWLSLPWHKRAFRRPPWLRRA